MPRRVALALFAVAGAVVALTPGASARQPSVPKHPAVYAALGAELIRFELDVESAALTRRESVMLPAHGTPASPR
jgi:hypothetical protein